MQERIKNANKTYSMLQKLFKNKNISKKLKLRLKNTIIEKTLTYASESLTLTNQLNIFERKVYRRTLGPVYDNEKEKWRILTNKEIYASVKKPTIIETISLNTLCWFGHVQRMEENRVPKRVYIYMNLGTRRLRGRPRNWWQNEVREDGRMEKGGRKNYITERNGRSSWERRGIVAFCTCQWNEWMNTELYINKIYGLVEAGNTLWFVTIDLIFWTDTAVHDLKGLKNRLIKVFPPVKNSPWKWLWIAETCRRLYCWMIRTYYYVHMYHKLIINTICYLKMCQTEHNLTYTDIHEWTKKKKEQTNKRTNEHLTNSIEQIHSREANLFSVSQEVPNIYGTWRFITSFTRAWHMSLFWARSIQSMPTHPTFWLSNLILGMPGFPSGLFPSCFPTKTLHAPLLSLACAMCPAHPILLDFITWITMDEEYRSLSSSLRVFHSPITLSLLWLNIFLSSLFSNTLSLCSSLNVNKQVSHLYKTRGKIIFPYILIFIFLDSKLEGQWFCTKW